MKRISAVESDFRTFFQSMADMVIVGTPDGRLLFANAAVTRMLGYSAEELATMGILDLHPQGKRGEAVAVLAAMGRGECESCPLPLARKDGSLVPVETRVWAGQWSGEECIFAMAKHLTSEVEAQQRFERLFRNNPAPMALSTMSDRRFFDVNDAFIRVLGYSRSDLIGRTTAELGLFVLPEQQASAGDLLHAGQRIVDVELQCRHKDGRVFDGLFSGDVITSQGKRYFLTVMIDITERKAAERQVALQQERLMLALEASGDSNWDSNWLTGEVHVSPRHYEMLGYPVGDLVTSVEAILALVHPDDQPGQLGYELTKTSDAYQCEHRMLAADGSWRWVFTRSKVIERSADGVPVRVIGVDTDMTDRRLREEELSFISSHDKLTGLFNRRYMKGYLRSEAVTGVLPTSLIMGDANGLKLTNDTFGHEGGDGLLVTIAGVLQAAIGELGTLARWGGDEFLAVLPGVDGAAALELAHGIQSACAAFPRDPLPLSVALGLATRLTAEQPVEAVMREAEEHMYHSKLMEGKSARSTIISALRETLSAKTLETDEHCQRMQTIAVDVVERMGLSYSTRDDILLLALLHDIGKIGVPEAILTKPGRLTPDERSDIEKHAEIGFRIAKASYELAHIAEGILSHHEWWNGAGYPQGLSGEAIPLASRVIGAIDAYDAMTSDRPYRAALTRSEALDELRRCAGTQFDPQVVAAIIGVAGPR